MSPYLDRIEVRLWFPPVPLRCPAYATDRRRHDVIVQYTRRQGGGIAANASYQGPGFSCASCTCCASGRGKVDSATNRVQKAHVTRIVGSAEFVRRRWRR